MAYVVAFVVIAAIIYALYVIYRNSDAYKLNEDGTASPFGDAFGNPTFNGWVNWLAAGMPGFGLGFRRSLANDWLWLVILVLVYLYYKLSRK